VKWQHLANYLGITAWAGLRKAKERLSPALRELKEKDYISDWSWDEDRLVVFAGGKYVEEHSARVRALDHYQKKQPLPNTAQHIENEKPPVKGNRLVPLASRWASGYDPSAKELLDRECTLADLESVAKAEGIAITRK